LPSFLQGSGASRSTYSSRGQGSQGGQRHRGIGKPHPEITPSLGRWYLGTIHKISVIEDVAGDEANLQRSQQMAAHNYLIGEMVTETVTARAHHKLHSFLEGEELS